MIVRIAGVVLPEKPIYAALTYIYGIGRSRADAIIKKSGVNAGKRPKDLTEQESAALREIIEKQYPVEGDLRREVASNIKRLKEIAAWRGNRHIRRLPIHGRTKTNSRTTRGNVRRTMGSGRRTAAEKT